MLPESDPQIDHGLFEMCEDFTSYLDSSEININAMTLDTLLEERNDFGSFSSSACSFVTSEFFDFDIGIDECVRFSNLSPIKPLNTVCKRKTTDSRKCSKKRRKNIPKFERKWSSLTSNEQTSALEQLVETASEKLGLREQLDIIKIISPTAELLPTDTEFFIDFELVDDHKFELVNLYVENELRRLESPKVKTKKTDNKQQNKLAVQQKEHNKQDLTKKPENVTKRCKQLRKEKKSGLFSREKVIAMASFKKTCEPECEEEIDILS